MRSNIYINKLEMCVCFNLKQSKASCFPPLPIYTNVSLALATATFLNTLTKCYILCPKLKKI